MSGSTRRRIAGVLGFTMLASGIALSTANVAQAQAPLGQDFVITPADLHYVVQQIEIGEAHARRIAAGNPNASPLCSAQARFDDGLYAQVWREQNGEPCVGSPLLPHGLRTVDGRWNNLHQGQTSFGSSGQNFPRMLEAEFRTAESNPFGPPGPATSYANVGNVWDSEPRTVSNLIVDQTTTNRTAVVKLLEFIEEGLDAHLIAPDGSRVDLVAPLPTVEAVMQGYPEHGIFLQNVATDEGLSAPFSSWMTIFGQFFDHGLDLVEKGGTGTVMIPLAPDDPLYDHPDFDPATTPPMLMLTRATNYDGREHRNRSTPFIDQNQTYTSHPSHQVFLREYELIDGRPVPTGLLLEGTDGGLATWADVKAQALNVLGIALDDLDIHDVPLVAVDPYGRFIPGENGLPQIATPVLVEGNIAAPVDASLAVSAGQAFLDDIAHSAVPDADYDAALLDDHFVTGDGRGNENIALTAAHHIFHSEHNRLINQISLVIDADTQFGLDGRFGADGYWDRPERMFQAARFFNEMQYQHLAVEEFLRTVVPSMNVQPLNESAYHGDLNAAITAEFAHVVYRFGHSMLTETLPRVYQDGTVEELSLLDGFLNPNEFTKNGAISPDEAAASLIRGLAGQVGNGIDEFVTDTLRNNLLGLPLDLATINMARARDVGVPSLNSARRQFYAATMDPTLEPYANWEAFRLELKHRDSIVNFIAAYGKGHPTLDGATTLDARRAAAEALVSNNTDNYMSLDAAAAGLDDVDFWMGGLAERTMVFGGMLGSTFNHVFESQAEALQNGDRFYYLTRNQGQNILAQLEANSFTELIQRNTTPSPMPLDVFTFPGHVFDLATLNSADSSTWPEGVTYVDGIWRYDGGEHVVFYGTAANDNMRGGIGDDTIWGLAGDDRIEGDDGADSLMGGDGDDIITDLFGDDTIIAGSGNDAIHAGPGGDLVLSGSGDDFMMLTKDDANSGFAGPGEDVVLGGTGNDLIWGGENDDWIEGGNGHDLLQGDNAIVWQNDPYGGHDVLMGGPGNNDNDSDGGDDIMVPSIGIDRNEGMLGFDWVTYKNHHLPVVADMRFTVLAAPDLAGVRDRFDLVEGLSGWEGNDVLRGLVGVDDIVDGRQGHLLTEEGLDRILGLRELLNPPGHPRYSCRFQEPVGACALPQSDSDGINNIILGGGGSDLIEGRAGDDFIDGDVWLDVQLEWTPPNGANQLFDSAQQMGARVMSGEIDAGDIRIRRSIAAPVAVQDGLVDTAVYASAAEQYTFTYLGDGYWEVFHQGADELEESEGRDILRNIEVLQFPDFCGFLPATGLTAGVALDSGDLVDCGAFGTIGYSTQSPVENAAITATVTIEANDPTDLVFEWQFGEDGEEFEPAIHPSTQTVLTQISPVDELPVVWGITSTYTPNDPDPGNHLRLVVSYVEDGVRRSIIGPRTDDPVENVNDTPTAPTLTPDAPSVGDVVTAVGLADEDGIESIVEDQIVEYRWEAQIAGSWQEFANTGTEPSVRLTADQQGLMVRVRVYYTDDHGFEESPWSDPIGPVNGPTPNNPATGTVTLSAAPGQDMVGGLITATVAVSDLDGPVTPTFTYQWQHAATADPAGPWTTLGSPSGPAIVPGDVLAGRYLRLRVSFTDGRGFAEQRFSEPMFVNPLPPPPPPPPTVVPDDFVPLVPQRLLDSRGEAGLIESGSTTVIDVSGVAGIEPGDEAVVLSVAVTQAGGNGHITVFPCDGTPPYSPPTASNLNFASGLTIANMVIAEISDEGLVCLFNSAATELVVDINGYFPAGSGYSALAPTRVIDTRDTAGVIGGGAVTTVDLSAHLDGNGLTGAAAVSLNLAIVGPGQPGYATVFPCDEPSAASSINFTTGQTISNAVVSKLDSVGAVCVQSTSDTEFVVDLNGAFASGSSLITMTPTRLLDTREGGGAPMVAGSVQVIQVAGVGSVPNGVNAASVNVAVTQTGGPGYVTLYPCDVATPTASNLNYVAPGQTIAVGAIVRLSGDGRLCLYSSASTHAIVDVNGVFPSPVVP